jgi:phosphatidylglycerol lysyltransferase
MELPYLKQFPHRLLRFRSTAFIYDNGRLIAQAIFSIFFFGLAIWFIKHEHTEIFEVKDVLLSSRATWLAVGIGISMVYVVLQGLMYVASFNAIGSNPGLFTSVKLFLKRNLISVFLPAGGISSLAFFSSDLEKKGITRMQIHLASTIYGFIGILSVIIVAIPVFIYSLFKGNIGNSEWFALLLVIALIVALYGVFQSLIRKGWVYRRLIRIAPSIEAFLEELTESNINRSRFLLAVCFSTLIEIAGITHLYIAMLALGYSPSLYAAVMAYIVSVVFLILSPFLRGLGAIEVSMTYVLIRFGFSNVEAIAITLFYRFLEFWLPLLAGAISFLLKVNKLLMRLLPAILLFVLGLINIISVLTPAIDSRVEYLLNYLPVDAITASNYFVMVAGLFLLVTAAFMLKGLRFAWWMSILLSFLSLIGHLTKAIDYEEASVAFAIILILIATRKEYYIKGNRRLRFVGIQTSLFGMLAVLIYGLVGFYFLDKKHFNLDFNWYLSLKYTIQNFLLIGSKELVPNDPFAVHFLRSINISGFISLAFLFYTMLRPYVVKNNASPEELEKAKLLLQKYGRSALDYFKVYNDKMIFISPHENAFVSFRVSGTYAIVLEDPVGEDERSRKECIRTFDLYCMEHGLKTMYYRVPEESLAIYKEQGKKSLFVGQEGIVDLAGFSLEGGHHKSLRNAIKRIQDKGYRAIIYQPPVKDGLIQKLKYVSDEWLAETKREEIVFSQGMFNWEEIKQQTILVVENAEEKVVAFLNLIPDYAAGESTYDLIRKTTDAPSGVMDFMLVELFKFMSNREIRFANLGFAPLSGIADPKNFPEQSMKFAYEKIRSFSHYKGLRDFKAKFLPEWHNKYLVFDNDYDLLQAPVILTRIIKP